MAPVVSEEVGDHRLKAGPCQVAAWLWEGCEGGCCLLWAGRGGGNYHPWSRGRIVSVSYFMKSA